MDAISRQLRRTEYPRFETASSLRDIPAAILAGGLGTRLRPVVFDRPKCLAEIGGRPCLAFLLDQLEAAGVRDVVLCTGHLGGQVRDAFGEGYGSMTIAYSHEPMELGTAGALRYALPHFLSDVVLVMNGDSFCDADLPAFAARHLAHGGPASLLLAEVPDTRRYGRVATDGSGRVVRFEEKDGSSGPGWINAGIYLLNRDALMTIPRGRPVSIEREMFPEWIVRGLFGFRSRGRFIDIGTPDSYAEAEHFFLDLVR